MKDEVEEFLRRVAQLRAQAEAQARAQQQRPGFQPPPAPSQRQAPPQRQTPPARLVPAQEEVVYLEPAEAEVVDAELAELGDSVGRHVTQHLRGDQEITAHTRQLGAEVDLADDKLEARLHQTFDHQVGHLRKTASDTAAIEHPKAAPDVTMAEIRTMLSTPASIRDAIVMAEILRRPEDRW
jgi:hypothetical protein